MLIAFHGNQHFSTRKGLFNGSRAVGLSLVPFGIALRRRMDVVLRRIAIRDRQLLVCLYSHNMRDVVASSLSRGHRGGGSWIGIVASLRAVSSRAVFDVNKHVREFAVFDSRVFSWKVWIRLSANRIRGRVNFLRRRSGTVERDCPRDAA